MIRAETEEESKHRRAIINNKPHKVVGWFSFNLPTPCPRPEAGFLCVALPSGTHSVDQADLPLPSERWDKRCLLPHRLF